MSSVAWVSWGIPLINHLWQSTVFAGGVGLLTLALRRNPARTRYRLWMAASLKFLLPFSLLMALGAHLPRPARVARTQPALTNVVAGARPLLEVWQFGSGVGLPATARPVHAIPVAHAEREWLPLLLLSIWVAGTLLILGRWAWNWLRLRTALGRGEAVTLADGTRALLLGENSERGSIEPGVFGIVRPVLALPRGIAERLTREQMDAIVAHELCHMRRRDNLTAALHMVVEALFWFHPGVWWLRARLVEERERACDEAVLEATREPLTYAEGILNVCKFYVEAPLSCVSGVTGSELKQRIARILSGQAVRNLDLRRKALLTVACVLAVGLPVTAGLVRAAQGETPAQNIAIEPHGIQGNWQGTMHLPDGPALRVVLKITRDDKGALSGTLYMVDENRPPMMGSSVSFSGGTLRFTNFFPGFAFEGKMAADGNSISGTVVQNGTFPLTLVRATAETEWAIPAPPPRMAPMAADAKPGVEVATVKPTAPGERAFMISMRGGELGIQNQTLMDLIKFAYEAQQNQVISGPGWMTTDRWDIHAKPDIPGMPNNAQIREMVQRLLGERFSLKAHEERREMAAYALTVGKDGAKMTKSADTSGMAGFTMGPLGTLHAGSATMEDFAHILENGMVDRPVVDQTGLSGKWDFTLQWTPDSTEFGGMPVRVPPPPADDANAAPPLFTAMREQLGLVLESKKTDVPVVVIDHVEKPSAN